MIAPSAAVFRQGAGDPVRGPGCSGVLGPEALPPKPFLDLVNEYGSPWGMREH